MPGTLNLFSSALASSLRGWAGITVRLDSRRPAHNLQLYDMENCPYCRLVREVITELDLDVEIYPCPKNGERFRPALIERGGKALFPYLVDPNTGVEMYESLDIVAYLFKTYTDQGLPLKWRLGGLQTFSSILASAARGNLGLRVKPSRAPEKMLELYSFEASPFARPVRELMCEMEIPYLLKSCGRSEMQEWLPPALRERFNINPDSSLPNRMGLQQREGKMGIPYLYDPNTDTGMFESDDIIDYLKQHYCTGTM